MAQYPIPQFIEEEGRIIFFLTFRQFFLLVGGGIACSLLFLLKLPMLIFAVCSLFIMASVSIIAFVKVNGIPIVKLALNFLGFLTKNKNYIWKKNNQNK